MIKKLTRKRYVDRWMPIHKKGVAAFNRGELPTAVPYYYRRRHRHWWLVGWTTAYLGSDGYYANKKERESCT